MNKQTAEFVAIVEPLDAKTYYPYNMTKMCVKFARIEGTEVRRPRYWASDEARFYDLVLQIQLDWTGAAFEVYAREMLYQGDTKTLEVAEERFRTFRAVHRSNWPVSPTTFGQYVALVCDSLGVKRFAFNSANGSEHIYDYTWASVRRNMQAEVDHEIYRFADAKYPDKNHQHLIAA